MGSDAEVCCVVCSIIYCMTEAIVAAVVAISYAYLFYIDV